MIIRGAQWRAGRSRRWLVTGLVVAGASAACGVSFVAGGEAHRQGMFHAWRERGLAALSPLRRVRAWAEAPEPTTLTLDIPFKHWRKLEERREVALDEGVRHGEEMDPVPGTLAVDGRVLDVKVRLRGRALDHLQGRKWSFRVETRGDGAYLGMRRFSLQHPGTRGFEREWLFHRLVREGGGLGLRYEFVRLVVNGEDLGLYALEEHLSKELLESQQRREGPMLRFDDTDRLVRKAAGIGDEIVRDGGNFASTPLDTYQTRRIDDSPALAAQREAALDLYRAFATGTRPASEVFDIQALARLAALSELFGTWHPLAFHNTRFYYDPVASRLEPIARDANSCLDGRYTLNALALPWLREALRDPELGRAYVAGLLEVSDPEWLVSARATFGAPLEAVALMLSREWPIEADALWAELEGRQAALREALDRGNLVQGFVAARADRAGADDGWQLELYNNTNLPVEVEALEVQGRVLALPEPILVPPSSIDAAPTPHRAVVHLPEPPPHRVAALCRFAGAERSRPSALHVQAAPGQGRPESPDYDTCVAQHRFLVPDGPGRVRIDAGTWTVDGDLVLPDGVALHVAGGVTLRFAPDAVLLTNGRLECAGSPEAPVRLVPADESGTWGGVAVIDAPPATWTSTEVTRTAGIERGGWMTTGGVTFQGTDVELRDCRFVGHRGEDALNVVRGAVTFSGLIVTDTFSDAFDGDFVRGTLRDCTFERIGGDAVDVSGSDLQLLRIVVDTVDDKAISAGERSRVVAAEIDVRRGGIGVASKDASIVFLRDAWIDETATGLAAYQKKPEYGAARIEASGVRLGAVMQPTLAQTRSEIIFEGRRTATRDVDVDRLYAQGASGIDDLQDLQP